MYKVIKLQPKSDVTRLVTRQFLGEVKLEVHDRDASCLITAQLHDRDAVQLALDLLACAGVILDDATAAELHQLAQL